MDASGKKDRSYILQQGNVCGVVISVGCRIDAHFFQSETHKATSEFKASLDNPSQESRKQARHKSPWVTPRYRFYIWISQTLGLRNICLDILESWDVEPSRNHHSSIQRLAALDAAPLGLRLTIVILTWQGGARIGLGLGLGLCLFLGH